VVVAALIFAAKWAVAGLAFAAVLLWIRPDLRIAASAPRQSALAIPVTQNQPLTKSGAQGPRAPKQQSLPDPLSTPAGSPPAANTPTNAPTTYADAVGRSAPAVVNIYTARVVTERLRPDGSAEFERLFGAQSPAVRQRVEGSLGSGVIVDARGHVVTNHHVIANAEKIRLQLADGRVADATVVGDDPDTDLALLQIHLGQLPVMQMGRSDQLRVGDVVLAIGSPYGLSQTVTHGIVSATGRDQILGLSLFESFLQTDAAINAGNSGGALVNTEGELIGINTAVLGSSVQRQGGTSEGIGFAIPVNMVRGVVDDLIKYGHVIRGWLGVNSQPVSAERAAQLGMTVAEGAEVIEVYANSPAAVAGLQVGDVITALNGQSVRDNREAMNRVAGLKPGSRLRIQGKGLHGTFDVRVTIAERSTN
jgi:serine protease DegS